MAVWTENDEILKAVVAPVTVDVVQGHRKPASPPVGQPAFLASVLL